MNKSTMIAVFVSLLMAGTAQAAGVQKKLRATVNETLLQNYVAVPPAGWRKNYQYAIATTTKDFAQKLAVVTTQSHSGYRGTDTIPTPTGLTVISLSNGAVLSKEVLPAALQITATDCTLYYYPPKASAGIAPYMGCPDQNLAVFPVASLRGRLVFLARKEIEVSNVRSYRFVTYVLDLTATSADRWTLVEDVTYTASTMPSEIPAWLQLPDRNFYVVNRSGPSTVQVFEITAK
jgi:hypothetical protein